MTPERKKVVIDSWKSLWPRRHEAGERFYRHLFAIDAESSALFRDTVMDAQNSKFIDMLNLLIDTLDSPERLVPMAKALGIRHASYGVRDEHYERMGIAIMHMLEDVLGTSFDDEARSAWSEAYLLLSSLMRRGAAAYAK